MLLRIFFTIIIIFSSNLNSLSAEQSGSKVELYLKTGRKVKGELIDADTTNIVISVRLAKTPNSNKTSAIESINPTECDSVIIPGTLNGSSPYIISGLLGIGAGAIAFGSSDNPNFYVSGAITAIVGFFSYLFIDNSITTEDIILTEIDKYPWKLTPYSKNYRPD